MCTLSLCERSVHMSNKYVSILNTVIWNDIYIYVWKSCAYMKQICVYCLYDISRGPFASHKHKFSLAQHSINVIRSRL